MGAAEAIRDHFNIEIWGSQEEDRFLFESLPQQSQQIWFTLYFCIYAGSLV